MIMKKINPFGGYLHRRHVEFGGAGASGTGACRAIEGFKRFSHARPVFVQRQAGHANLPMRAPRVMTPRRF